jgi:hypothetical protein
VDPFRTLKLRPLGSRMTGEDVEDLQSALNGHLAAHARVHEGSDQLMVDGSYGPATRAAYRWVGWYATGLFKSTIDGGANVAAQRLIAAAWSRCGPGDRGFEPRRSPLTRSGTNAVFFGFFVGDRYRLRRAPARDVCPRRA